jgi:hypothetical protein
VTSEVVSIPEDVDLYTVFVKVPVRNSTHHMDMDINRFSTWTLVDVDNTDHIVRVQRRNLLQDQNNSTENGNIIDMVGSIAANSLKPLIKVPRNESEIMNYVGVIFATLSSLAAISGLCFHRRITYVTVNHHKTTEVGEKNVSKQSGKNPQMKAMNSVSFDNIEQNHPLLHTNERLVETGGKHYMNVEVFLRPK